MNPPVVRTAQSRFAWLAFVLAVGLVVGCSSSPSRPDPTPIYPVEGRLVVDGKPAGGAIVTFHPTASMPIQVRVRDDGRFVPSQSDGAVGLAEGSYALTAIWPDGPNDRFAGRYADAAKPVATVIVKPGINLIPAITLKQP